MDEMVKQAMAKWPNVPHCYGWLGLDGRGAWRMRDERAQAEGRPGDKIGNATLVSFINRNYTRDEQGRWYFQNGPQRVYVSLEQTPYIARTDPAQGFILHTGAALGAIDAAWMTEAGQLLLQSGDVVAMVDDRDMAQCMPMMQSDGASVTDEQMTAWLNGADAELRLQADGRLLPIQRIAAADIPERFGFIRQPRP